MAETHNDPTIRKLDIGSVRYRHCRAALVLSPIGAARHVIKQVTRRIGEILQHRPIPTAALAFMSLASSRLRSRLIFR